MSEAETLNQFKNPYDDHRREEHEKEEWESKNGIPHALRVTMTQNVKKSKTQRGNKWNEHFKTWDSEKSKCKIDKNIPGQSNNQNVIRM